MEILFVISGVVIGILISRILQILRTVHGVLRVDHSSQEKDAYLLELYDDIEELSNKTLLIKVDNDADFSQK